jgi:hypothetical protein
VATSGVDLGHPSAGFATAAAHAVRQWQADILVLVGEEGSSKKVQGRIAALGVNAVGVSLMLVAFSHTAGLTGAEVGIAGGTAVVAQKVLELIFGDESVRRLATRGKELLDQRSKDLMSEQLGRFTAVLESLRLDPALPAAIQATAEEVDRLRGEELVALSLQAVLTPAEQAAVQIVEDTGLERAVMARPGAVPGGV